MTFAENEQFDPNSGSKKSGGDADTERKISEHCEEFGVSPLDAINHFAVLMRRQNLKRFLAHTELFKMTLNVPGDIAELGVFRGLGLMGWANLLESYCIGNRTKIVFGFDNWSGFTALSPKDGVPRETAGKLVGGFNPARFKAELESAINIFDQDRFIPYKPRIRLIDGDIEKTASSFIDENPGVRFSLVHFDCDLYGPTKAALEAFWPSVSRGGVVLFDEYGIHDWPGETAAVDEFLANKPDIKLQTFPWTNTPAAWLVKP